MRGPAVQASGDSRHLPQRGRVRGHRQLLPDRQKDVGLVQHRKTRTPGHQVSETLSGSSQSGSPNRKS